MTTLINQSAIGLQLGWVSPADHSRRRRRWEPNYQYQQVIILFPDSSKFFLLTSANPIITTFAQIGTQLSDLRLAK